MARQSGNICITGTIDQLCFYQMDGKFYVRLKSSLTGKRVKKDPAFKATMYYAGLMGQASKLASQVYQSLPEAVKEKGLYRQFTGKAMQWLKEGKDPDQVKVLLQKRFAQKTIDKQAQNINVVQTTDVDRFTDIVIGRIPAKTDDIYHASVFLPMICHSPP